MAITLSNGTTTVELPPDLQWSDEFAWSGIEQEKEYSLTGALIVQQGRKAKGRPITLLGAGGAWIKRAALLELLDFYTEDRPFFTLSYHGREFKVLFENTDGLRATEVLRQANPGPDHLYTIELRFFEAA